MTLLSNGEYFKVESYINWWFAINPLRFTKDMGAMLEIKKKLAPNAVAANHILLFAYSNTATMTLQIKNSLTKSGFARFPGTDFEISKFLGP